MDNKDQLIPSLNLLKVKVDLMLYAVKTDKGFPIPQDLGTMEEISVLVDKIKIICNGK